MSQADVTSQPRVPSRSDGGRGHRIRLRRIEENRLARILAPLERRWRMASWPLSLSTRLFVPLGMVGCADAGRAVDITDVSCFGGPLPFVAVYGSGAYVLILVGLMAVRAARWHWLARAADASVKSDAPLREGSAVLSGRVAPDEAEPALRVEIELAGIESKDDSGNWSHRWDEKGRRIRVRPFAMELPSGARIRVEPTHEVQLADALDGVIRVKRTAKILFAELTPGEALIAVGRLERRPRPDGYRGSTDQWVLVPPKSGKQRMLLSTEPLGTRFRRRAMGSLFAIGLTVIGLLALHGIVFGYHLRVLRGHTVVGQYMSHQTWTTVDGEGHPHHHRQLTVRLPDASIFAREVTTAGPVGDAYVRLVPGYRWATHFGRSPTLHWLALVLRLAYPLFAHLAFKLLTRRQWYEGRRQRSAGNGRILPERPTQPK